MYGKGDKGDIGPLEFEAGKSHQNPENGGNAACNKNGKNRGNAKPSRNNGGRIGADDRSEERRVGKECRL